MVRVELLETTHRFQMRPLKICHIVATTEGATWMVEQLRQLRNRYGFEVFAVISSGPGRLADKLRAENINFYSRDFNFNKIEDLFLLPKKILSLIRLFRRERFDIIQTHVFRSVIIGRIAAWLADVPERISMITSPAYLEGEIPRFIDLATYWMDNKVIASCQYTQALYKSFGVKDKCISLIYYGIDSDKFDPATTNPVPIREEFGCTPDTPLIVMVAYFYPRFAPSRRIPPKLWNRTIKGQEYLIRAMPRILKEFPKTKCLLVGSGWKEEGEQYLREMQILANSLNLEEKVIFTGFRSDINNILRSADVSLQPSLSENLGGTIESLLMECPTVASHVGGMTDTIIDGETGILVEPANVEDLAEGILKLLRNPEWARSLGKNGRRYMLERFTLNKTVDDLNNLYQEVADAKKNRRGYRMYVSFWRMLIAMPWLAYLTLRLIIFDKLR